MRILIAEVDPGFRNILRSLVEEAGHQAVIALDGQQALDQHRSHRCDLLITDWQLPRVDGLALSHLIRKHDGESAYTWIILLTARQDQDDLDESSAAGVDDLLPTPVRRHELLRRLKVARRIVQLQQALAAERAELKYANARMAGDLHAAEQAQRALLPHDLHLPAPWNIAWRYRPCQELAGDLLGVERLDEHHLGLHVFDVSGHGVSSAMMAVQVHRHLSVQAGVGSALLEYRPDGPQMIPPAEVARRLNDLFVRPNSSRFVTLAYAILDLRDGSLDLVSCAHPSPLILRADGRIDRHDIESHPLGILPTKSLIITTWRDRLFPGDRLLFTSDGLIEAANLAKEDFTVDRLADVIRHQPDLELALDQALAAVRDWTNGPPADDQTLLLISRA